MNEMPKGGAKELLKSSEGRRYLAELQKRYKHDIVQPSTDPHLFEQLYGGKIRRRKEVEHQQERQAKDMWEENKERRVFKKRDSARAKRIII